jgi:hypothetical protein
MALELPFSEKEIKEAIFSSYPAGAPSPDGLPFLFYQKFWDLIKTDFCRMVQVFQSGGLDLFRLNFSSLTLIPKVEEDVDMRNFRPISLLNCSFKIFSKLLTLRLESVCQRLIAKEQSAFIRGRYILESDVIAHEVAHSLHKSKESSVIIKLDYEKMYDRVNTEFLMKILEGRGFGELWIKWISKVVSGGSVCVLANGEESGSFKIGKGLSQGDPLSPFLFNLVGDVLNRLLARASDKGLTRGLMRNFRPQGVLTLQYTDDTLLFASSDDECIKNLKVVLKLFE